MIFGENLPTGNIEINANNRNRKLFDFRIFVCLIVTVTENPSATYKPQPIQPLIK